MNKLKLKKLFAVVGITATLFSITGTMCANAYGKTAGTLNVSYHYVPLLKDSASGTTCTNYAPSNKNSTSKLWVQTTVYAYDKNGKYVKSTGKKCYGTAALEGWSSTKATAEIKNIKKAKGTHNGGTTGYGSKTAYTSWSR